MYTIVTQAVWFSQMGMSMTAKQAILSAQADGRACLRLTHGRPSQMRMPMTATQATLSAQPDGHAYDCHMVGPARWAYLRLPHRLHCRPSQMSMLTIATRSVQPDAHAYQGHRKVF